MTTERDDSRFDLTVMSEHLQNVLGIPSNQAVHLWVRLYGAVQFDGKCWLFCGKSVGSSGYGQLRIGHSRDITVHRLSYIAANGHIPEGLCVLHRCDVRLCVNPAHLFLGTKSDNSRDMVAKGRHYSDTRLRTHCPKGHPYDSRNSRGARICTTCNREARARHIARKTAAANAI